MTRNPSPTGGEHGPVSENVFQLAADIHRSLESTLGMPGVFDEQFEQQTARYPYALFSNLAIHLAGKELAPGASSTERQEALTSSLQHILATPSLLERMTDAVGNASAAIRQAENPKAQELQQKVAERGFLSYSMIPGNSMVQLVYAARRDMRVGMKRNGIPKGTEVACKLVPIGNIEWNVVRYNSWTSEEGFTGQIGAAKARYPNIMRMTAVTSEVGLPGRLTGLVGEYVTMGEVSTGKQFQFNYHFTRKLKEVPGHEPQVEFRTESEKNLTLVQAYLGDSRQYPLFR